jgi:hypothetical protein
MEDLHCAGLPAQRQLASLDELLRHSSAIEQVKIGIQPPIMTRCARHLLATAPQ